MTLAFSLNLGPFEGLRALYIQVLLLRLLAKGCWRQGRTRDPTAPCWKHPAPSGKISASCLREFGKMPHGNCIVYPFQPPVGSCSFFVGKYRQATFGYLSILRLSDFLDFILSNLKISDLKSYLIAYCFLRTYFALATHFLNCHCTKHFQNSFRQNLIRIFRIRKFFGINRAVNSL